MNHHLRKQIIFLAGSFLLPLFCCADSESNNPSVNLYLSGGVSHETLANDPQVVITNLPQTNTFTPTTGSARNVMGGIGVGYQLPSSENFTHAKMVFGFSSFFMNLGQVRGNEINPNGLISPTFTYQFSARSTPLLLESHLGYAANGWQLYSVEGLGIALNTLYNYSETPLPNAGISASLFFGNNTTPSFAYEVGVGLAHELSHDRKHDLTYSVSLDYRYLHLGDFQLQNSGILTGDHLQIRNLNVHAVMLSLIIAFGYEAAKPYLLSGVPAFESHVFTDSRKSKSVDASGLEVNAGTDYHLSSREKARFNAMRASES